MSKATHLARLLEAENAKRDADAQLPDVAALEAVLLDTAVTSALFDQENVEINAIASAYRLLDHEAKLAVRRAAGVESHAVA